MTDKEKAHEYAIGLNCEEMKMGELMALRQGGELGYLFGLTEGRKEKWHDLRENPNDLPEKSGEYWCKWEDGTYSTEHYFADSGFGSYVIAWCELPKFEE